MRKRPVTDRYEKALVVITRLAALCKALSVLIVALGRIFRPHV